MIGEHCDLGLVEAPVLRSLAAINGESESVA